MHLNCQPTERKRLSCSPSGSRSLCSGETPTRSGRAAGMLAGRHFAAAALGAPRPRTGQRQYGRAHGGTQTAVAVSTTPHRSEAAPHLMLSEKASHGRRHTEQFRQKYMLRAQVWTHRREMRAQETQEPGVGVSAGGEEGDVSREAATELVYDKNPFTPSNKINIPSDEITGQHILCIAVMRRRNYAHKAPGTNRCPIMMLI